MRLYDAHNHLQDDRLKSRQEQLVAQSSEVGVARMVVNGACEEDWPAVAALARRHPIVVPSFGYHPWYVRKRTPDWQERLVQFLDAVPSAVGEIGLDRWILDQHRNAIRTKGPQDSTPSPASLEEQIEVFVGQLHVAARRNLPVSIHCLQAWGLLHDLLRHEPRPTCGFLLHSYGGPVEMVKPLADLGAYFSLPGYFAHARKQRQRETFRQVPPDRLLIETDAPDQCLPAERTRFPITDETTGRALNHPANIAAVYEFAAELLDESLAPMAARIEGNFQRLFREVMASPRD